MILLSLITIILWIKEVYYIQNQVKITKSPYLLIIAYIILLSFDESIS